MRTSNSRMSAGISTSMVEELEPRRFQNDVQIVKVAAVPIVICGKKAASVTIEHQVLQLLLL